MGYLDSRLMANHYRKAYRNDQNQLARVNMRVNSLKKEQETSNVIMNDSYNSNKSQIQSAYSGELSSLNKQLQEALQAGNQNKINDLNNQIDQLKREEKIALSQLEIQKNEIADRYQNSLAPKESYWESRKEYWTQQSEMDKGCWESAKEQMKEALKSLFPAGGGGSNLLQTKISS